jgi:hypothetical protein
MRAPACIAVVVTMSLALATPAAAQPLGTFSWQLAPYCNVVTVTVTQIGAQYTLDGYENQCGAAVRAAVVGIAVPNPSGSVTLGFTIVTPPGGLPVHVQTAIDLGSLGGAWSDNQGNTGAFVFTPSGTAPGSPRPPGSSGGGGLATGSVTSTHIADGTIGADDIDPSQVQRRIGNACPAGQVMTGVGQSGAVTCQPGSSSGGDITAVQPGAGLTGGGAAGDVTLAVNFGADGTAASAARSDHAHAGAAPANQNTAIGLGAMPSATPGAGNVAVGYQALQSAEGASNSNVAVGYLALADNTTGGQNVAIGARALLTSDTGANNIAIGWNALASNTTAFENVAIGYRALDRNTIGTGNVAVGAEALFGGLNGSGVQNVGVGYRALADVTTGGSNTAAGPFSLQNLTTGSANVGIGNGAGGQLTTGSNNLYLANPGGNATESGTIRIGLAINHSRAFVAGVSGVTTGQPTTAAVVIDSTGQLGTISSTRRVKEDIRDLGEAGQRLQQLRPVQFRYIAPYADGSKPLQFGLIAEEVEAVLPELVAYGDDGQPSTVMYHVLPSLLVAEVQRLERERAAQDARLSAQGREIDALRAELATLRHTVTAVR